MIKGAILLMRFSWVIYLTFAVTTIIGAAYLYRDFQLSEGQSAYEKQDYPVALKKLSPFSGWYDPRAESEVGNMYLKGQGVEQNFQSAFSFLLASASSGFAHGEFLLGTMYDLGEGVPVDNKLAVYWYQKAADQDDPVAEYDLALHYFSGAGVPKDFSQAVNWYQKAADQGDADAENNLGQLYWDGGVIPRDYSKAAIFFQRAAEQGDGAAEQNLGQLYQNGEGITQDYTQAAYWYKQAVSQGFASAENSLGILYHSGNGVPQDDGKAFDLWQKSADQGDRNGQFNLGVAYFNGEGVSVDTAKAADMFLKATMQGQAEAEDALGQLYEAGFIDNSGNTIPDNQVLAYALFDLSAAQGFSAAESSKDTLSKKLTPEQIASGQTMAGEWQIGTPLPSKLSYEDLAPQILFDDSGTSTPAETYQNSWIWFSRLFATKNGPRYVVFVVTKGGDNSDCHACSANISEVTFDPTSDWKNNYDEQSQINFAQIGSWGDVFPLDDPNAPYTSAQRVSVNIYKLNRYDTAFLTPDEYSGQGDDTSGDNIFVYDADANYKAGIWKYAGFIKTSDSFEGDEGGGVCGNASNPQDSERLCPKIPAYTWTGSVKILPLMGSEWPELVVQAKGTVDDPNDKLIPAPDEIYKYDGRTYVQIEPSPPSL